MRSKILKAYKYRLYPNKDQTELLNKHIGCCRFIWNWALDKKTKTYQKTGKSISRFDLQSLLPFMKKEEAFLWLKEVNSLSLQATLEILEKAFTGFFRDKKGYPKFKSKRNETQSFSIPQNTKVDFQKNLVSIPKIKNIKIKLHRSFDGKIKTCTISRNAIGQFFISILVENNQELPIRAPLDENQAIGIDLGIKHFISCSDGSCFDNPKILKSKLLKLQFLQRNLSRKEKGSKNREKARKSVAKLHLYISNFRKNFLHQLTSKLVKSKYTSFCVENLDIKEMLKNNFLSREISDASWSTFLSFLSYKCGWLGKNIVQIGRFEASSQICSYCGNRNQKVKDLSVRDWQCASCQILHDRDINAAKNILRFAFVKHQTGLERPDEPVDGENPRSFCKTAKQSRLLQLKQEALAL